jgi:hypothetical protein
MTLSSLLECEMSISYSQLCVFDAELRQPYNEWLPEHNKQRFTWRPGSVSFATIVDVGDLPVHVELADVPFDDSMVSSSSAACIISVPFAVPVSGLIEVGSILTGKVIRLLPGRYQLVFSDFGRERGVKLTFCFCLNSAPQILKHYGKELQPTTLLMHARPG